MGENRQRIQIKYAVRCQENDSLPSEVIHEKYSIKDQLFYEFFHLILQTFSSLFRIEKLEISSLNR